MYISIRISHFKFLPYICREIFQFRSHYRDLIDLIPIARNGMIEIKGDVTCRGMAID